MTEEVSLSLPRSYKVDKSIALVVPALTAADLTDIVETHAPTLFRVAHSIVRNRAEAEDTVQDVFLRVLQHQLQLPAIRDLRVWLIRIAWNLALDRRRRIRPDQIDDAFARTLIGASVPADAALNEAQQVTLTLREIDRLPKLERQALLLSALEELSITEVAGIMNKSDSAVRALLFRARTRLRYRLAKGGKP